MSNLTLTKGDTRYIQISKGGYLGALLHTPTPSFDNRISPPSAVINKQYIIDNVPTLGVTNGLYAALSGASFTGPVYLNGEPPEYEHTAIDKGYLDSKLEQRDPTLVFLAPDETGSVVWDPSPYQLARLDMTSDVSLSIANQIAGATYKLIVVQPSPQPETPWQLTFSEEFAWPSGLVPTLSETPGAIDLFTFVSTGQRMLATGQTDYF